MKLSAHFKLPFKEKIKFLFTYPTISGFTLIEILIAISIVAIMATIGLLVLTRAQVNARDAKRKDDLSSIKKAMYLMQQEKGSFCIQSSGIGTGCVAPMYYQSTPGSGWTGSNVKTALETPGTPPGSIPPYIKTLPLDPIPSQRQYALYLISETQFILFAQLEGAPPASVQSTCGTAVTPTTSPYYRQLEAHPPMNYCITD